MSAVETPAYRAVHALYIDHHGWLKSWLQRRLGCSHSAADLAHDAFLRLLGRGSSSFGQEPRALLRHIANGLVIDHWRRQTVERAYLESVAHLPELEVPSPEVRLAVIESLLQIDAMLRRLPALTRDVFLQAQLEGATHAQLAERHGVCLNTVRRHIHKALVACITAL